MENVLHADGLGITTALARGWTGGPDAQMDDMTSPPSHSAHSKSVGRPSVGQSPSTRPPGTGDGDRGPPGSNCQPCQQHLRSSSLRPLTEF